MDPIETSRQPTNRLPADERLDLGPPAAEPTDAELLDQVVAGNWDAFDQFVDRYEGRLIGYLCRRLGALPGNPLSEDLAQETFLRVFRATKGGSHCTGNASVATWLFAIANNLARDHFRAAQRRTITLASDLPAAKTNWDRATSREIDPSLAAEKVEGDQAVRDLLASLPAEQAEVIALKLFSGLRFAEVAEVTGAPITTVKSRMTYGLKKICDILKLKGAAHEPRNS